MVRTTIDVYGRVDILFNNAGFGRLDWLENLDTGRDIQTQVDVNLTGLMQVTRTVLPHMLKQGKGHIINMSSVAGWIAPPLYSVYAATKFGVRGFTNALRREVRHLGIEVSGIYPGPAVTEFGQHTGDNTIKKNLSTPGWIQMTSEFVAEKVVQLAQKPRRTMILPWWFGLIIWLDNHFPAISDFFQMQFAKKYHQQDG